MKDAGCVLVDRIANERGSHVIRYRRIVRDDLGPVFALGLIELGLLLFDEVAISLVGLVFGELNDTLEDPGDLSQIGAVAYFDSIDEPNRLGQIHIAAEARKIRQEFERLAT